MRDYLPDALSSSLGSEWVDGLLVLLSWLLLQELSAGDTLFARLKFWKFPECSGCVCEIDCSLLLVMQLWLGKQVFAVEMNNQHYILAAKGSHGTKLTHDKLCDLGQTMRELSLLFLLLSLENEKLHFGEVRSQLVVISLVQLLLS